MQLSHVELPPATCLFCRRTPEPGELFVNTNTKIVRGPVRDHGYICLECAGSVAGAAGWIDPKEFEKVRDNGIEWYRAAQEAEAALEEARSDALAFIREVAATQKPAPAPKTRARKPADEPVSEG